jgi:uncharacterized membrane protein YbhN (UPF0104 family)
VIRAVWAWARPFAGLAILVLLVWRLGAVAFLDGLRLVDGGTLVAALGIGLLTTVLSAWRWRLVARSLGLRLPLGSAVADYYRALFLNAALPGGVLGDVHRAVRHGQHVGDVGRGVRAVVLERSAGQVVLVVVGAVVLLAHPSLALAEADHLGMTPTGAFVVGVLSGLAVALAAGIRPWRGGSRWHRACRTALADVRLGLLARDSWPGVLVSSSAVLAGHLAMFFVAARVAGASAPLVTLAPLMLLALLAMALPLNVGGWGPREGVLAWAFGMAGLSATQGLTVAVVYGVCTFVASLPGLGVLVVRWINRPRPDGPQVDLEERVLAEVGAAGRGA